MNIRWIFYLLAHFTFWNPLQIGYGSRNTTTYQTSINITSMFTFIILLFIEGNMQVQTSTAWFYYVRGNGMHPKCNWHPENWIFVLTKNSFGYPLSLMLGYTAPNIIKAEKCWQCQTASSNEWFALYPDVV